MATGNNRQPGALPELTGEGSTSPPIAPSTTIRTAHEHAWKDQMPAEHPSRPTLSTTQLMSSALAAVTAAVVGSRLGIAGTLAGAAAGSVIGTIGTTMYAHWLDRTASKVRTVVRLPTSSHAPRRAPRHCRSSTPSTPARRHRRIGRAGRRKHARDRQRQPVWRTVGLAAAATFAVAIASITAFEAITGEPVSTLTGGDAGNGTTLGRAVDSGPGTTVIEPDPAPTTPPSTPHDSDRRARRPPTSTPTETPTPTETTTSPTTPPPTSPPPTSPTSPPPT